MKPVTLRERFGEFPAAFRNFRKDLSLRSIERVYLLRSQWDCTARDWIVSYPYLFYRSVFAAYFVIGLIFSVSATDVPSYWIIYVTNWNFSFQTVYSVLSLCIVAIFWYQERFGREHPYYHLKLNGLESYVWFMLTVTYSTSVYISVAYWTLVYGSSGDTTGTVSIWASLVVHGFNAVLSVIDVLVVAAPMRVSHFVYVIGTSVAYELFSLLYELLGGTYKNQDRPFIYGVLNWRETPEVALVTCVGTIVAVTVLHFGFWALSVIRQHFAEAKAKVDYYADVEDVNENTGFKAEVQTLL